LIKYILIFLILCISFLSCENPSDSNPQENSNNFYPLNENNLWRYYYTTMYNTGVHLTTNVKKDTLVENDKWYLVSGWIPYKTFGEYYLKNQSDGLWKKDRFTSSPYLYLKYPCKVNDSYETPDEIVTVISVNDTIKLFTTNQEYVTVQYKFVEIEGKHRDRYEYLVPNIGVIRIDYKSSTISSQDLDSLVIN